MTAFEVGVRGVDFAVLELVAEVMGAKAVSSIVTASQTVSAITEGVTLLDIVTCLTTPVTYLAIVFAPGMHGTVANGNLSFASSFAFKVGSLVHVVVNATMDMGDGVGGSQAFRAAVHGKSFSLEGLFEGSNVMGNLSGFGVVGAKVLDFPL